MADEFGQELTAEQLAAIKAGLAEIAAKEEGVYTFPSREAPLGYTTLRYSYKHADVHPSWLRTLMSKGGFEQFDIEGAPATVKNERGTWAIRIDALKQYEAGKREPGTGEGVAYKYEPMVLKCAKRTLSAAQKRNAPEAVIEYLKGLVHQLQEEWEAGKIGTRKPGEEPEEGGDDNDEAEMAPVDEGDEADEDDEDFDFDFEDEDED